MMPKDFKAHCLSCGVNISSKRKDAKYCSDRCRMRYRRELEKEQLLGEIIALFYKIPNHSVQCTDNDLCLKSWDVIGRTSQKYYFSDLKKMSNQRLKKLKMAKKSRLAGENFAILLKPWIKKLKN